MAMLAATDTERSLGARGGNVLNRRHLARRYTGTMRRWVLGVVLLAVAGLSFGAMRWRHDDASAGGAASVLPAYSDELRYIGRDYLTGMPAVVNDRFIAEVEQAIADYNKEDAQPVPPPPPGPVDVASIDIAALGASAKVGRYGLDRAGRLDVPQDRGTVGWNPGFTAQPGIGKSTFFAAHFFYAGRPGVFNRLSTLRPGDEVRITLSDGAALTYRVTSTIDYALGAIDMGAILAGREGVESITLMTCSGPPNEGSYPLRTVVLAERIGG